MEISGVIQSGAGKGAFFTQVDWVVHQCQKMLDYKPFPGTLNVRVNDEDVEKLDLFFSSADFELVPDDPAFCAAQVKKIELNGIAAAVVIPSEDVRIHENRILEVISACSLKRELGLADGDTVRLTWPTADKKENKMSLEKDIFEFASSAGALEGYVYPKEEMDEGALKNWVNNLVKQYNALPAEARASFQAELDRSIGRAVHALTPRLGDDHDHIKALKSLIVGEMPASYNDFATERGYKTDKYGA